MQVICAVFFSFSSSLRFCFDFERLMRNVMPQLFLCCEINIIIISNKHLVSIATTNRNQNISKQKQHEIERWQRIENETQANIIKVEKNSSQNRNEEKKRSIETISCDFETMKCKMNVSVWLQFYLFLSLCVWCLVFVFVIILLWKSFCGFSSIQHSKVVAICNMQCVSHTVLPAAYIANCFTHEHLCMWFLFFLQIHCTYTHTHSNIAT